MGLQKNSVLRYVCLSQGGEGEEEISGSLRKSKSKHSVYLRVSVWSQGFWGGENRLIRAEFVEDCHGV